MPLEGLDLGPHSTPEAAWEAASSLYDLVGVVCHKGPTPTQGHYVAWQRAKASACFRACHTCDAACLACMLSGTLPNVHDCTGVTPGYAANPIAVCSA